MSHERTQAVAGVVPPDVAEAVIMQVWPSISAGALGRLLGRVYSVAFLGRLAALVTFPLAILVYFLPTYRLKRYTITTRRVLIQKGLRPRPVRDMALEQIDEVQVVQRPGQEYFRAGDVQLLEGGQVKLELPGVQAPENLRHNILEARNAYALVMRSRRAEEALHKQAAEEPEGPQPAAAEAG